MERQVESNVYPSTGPKFQIWIHHIFTAVFITTNFLLAQTLFLIGNNTECMNTTGKGV